MSAFSDASHYTAIQAYSTDSSLELTTGAVLVLNDPVSVVLNGRIELTNATVWCAVAGPVSSIEAQADSTIEWKASRFGGAVNISIAAGATIKEVSTCSFGSNVVLALDNNISPFKWRNNNVTGVAHLNRAYACEAVLAGFQAGCDRKAECYNNTRGGVHCACKGKVTEGNMADPGTECTQKTGLSAYYRENTVSITIRKPKTTLQQFYIVTEGEGQYTVTVQSTGSFIAVQDYSKEFKLIFDLNSAKSRGERLVDLSLNASRMSWRDSEVKNGTVLVDMYDGMHKVEKQTLNVKASLQPYPSCEHTKAYLSSYALTHLEGQDVTIVPRDTDDEPIMHTPFKFDLRLQNTNTPSEMYTAGVANLTKVRAC